MMKQLRVGILGTGGIAAAHVKSLQKLPGVSVVGLCNHHLEKAEQFNAKHCGSAADCYSNFAEMLDRTPMDALHVCIPPGAHGGEAEAAAARGIHLFLEKPIALTIERAESIVAAVHRAGIRCQMGHHFRHTAPALRLKSMLDDGSAGRPLLMQGQWFNNRLYGDWWRDPEMGGGQLIEQSIHLYDLARYFLGDAISVAGFVGRLGHDRFPQYRVDDTSAATIRFRNGAVASLCGSNCADPWNGLVSATVICEKVFVQFQNPDEGVFLYHGGMVSEEAWQPGVERKSENIKSTSQGMDEINRNFIAGVRGEEAMRSSVDDGLEDLRLVLGVTASGRAGGMPQNLQPLRGTSSRGEG
jgi:predicted dehydrogenase